MGGGIYAYNPIEEAFSKVKTLLKHYKADLEMEQMDLEDIVLAAFSSTTMQDCTKWMEDCGIYMSTKISLSCINVSH